MKTLCLYKEIKYMYYKPFEIRFHRDVLCNDVLAHAFFVSMLHTVILLHVEVVWYFPVIPLLS